MTRFRINYQDDEDNDWTHYIHRNLTRDAGHDVPYPGSAWAYATGESAFDEESHRGKGPNNWKKSDDVLYEDVCEALYHSPDVDASEIEVAVENGTVSLSGQVDSRLSKKMAEEVIEEVPGVWDIHNSLTIKAA